MTDAAPSPSRIIPNTFQTPNLLTDNVMQYLTGNEVKCYLVIVRKTLGWHKGSDRIARSQIMTATGLGESAVDAAMASLTDFRLVFRVAENNPRANIGVEWALNLDDLMIKWDLMQKRASETREAKSKSVAKARKAKGGVDGQPYLDGQGGGGVDGHGTQKPLSKANNNDDDTARKSDIAALYEQEFGALTPLIADAIRDAEKEFPEEWIRQAMKIAVERGARNWRFVLAVLNESQAKKTAPNLNRKDNPKGKRHDAKPRPTSKPDAKQADPAAVAEINRRNRRKRGL